MWNSVKIEGFLLDITGVLYNSDVNGGTAIPGSIHAVKRLRESGVPVRFVTNETTITRETLVTRLRSLGFDLDESEVFPPAPAVKRLLKDRQLRPHLLVSEEAEADYCDVDQTNPNCLIIADAGQRFSYENLNAAFQLLMTADKPKIFSLGIGRYYRHGSDLHMDVGCFTKAIEYAVGVEAEIVGKPSKTFFQTVLDDIGLPAEKVVMIGDDIVNDVGGAQLCGIHGVLVRTGKFRVEDERHVTVRPDDVVDDLSAAVTKFLSNR